jgi:spore coat polysaccharide biosynthesis protein SpsF (cytidylyltransferase family)
MNSSRLPRKAVKQLGSLTCIEQVIARCLAIGQGDNVAQMMVRYGGMQYNISPAVVLCCTFHHDDKHLVHLASCMGIESHLGHEGKVAQQFLSVGQQHNASTLVRVTGDSPLLEPAAVRRTIEHHLATEADYTRCEGYPVGVTAEVFQRRALAVAFAWAQEDTPHLTELLNHPKRFKVEVVEPPPEHYAPDLRLVQNYPEEHELLEDIYSALGDNCRLEHVIPYLTEKVKEID